MKLISLIAIGLIPARAGNTGCTAQENGGHGAHPRSRGEHLTTSENGRQKMGSSPLARGTPLVPAAGFAPGGGSSPLARGTHRIRSAAGALRGLIPARAGNTRVRAVRIGVHRAHPRSRGEHATSPAARMFAAGSSPLARGTLAILTRHDQPDGLIPARAGNTARYGPKFIRYGAHPRSRGEHLNTGTTTQSQLGSSPLARGTRLL